MRILVHHEDTQREYTFGLMKLFKELGSDLTEKQVEGAVLRILERT